MSEIIEINADPVANFMRAAGQECNSQTARLYLGLMLEEMAEAMDAEGYTSMARNIDAMADQVKSGVIGPDSERNHTAGFDAGVDVLWVTFGYMLACRYPIMDGWCEVSRSNASKIVDGVMHKDANGKVIKPATYCQPNLAAILHAVSSVE